jgi:hypothetical protein
MDAMLAGMTTSVIAIPMGVDAQHRRRASAVIRNAQWSYWGNMLPARANLTQFASQADSEAKEADDPASKVHNCLKATKFIDISWVLAIITCLP